MSQHDMLRCMVHDVTFSSNALCSACVEEGNAERSRRARDEARRPRLNLSTIQKDASGLGFNHGYSYSYSFSDSFSNAAGHVHRPFTIDDVAAADLELGKLVVSQFQRTIASLLYVAQQHEKIGPDMGCSALASELASEDWSRELREKVHASKERDAKRERAQVLVQHDELDW